jgi:hypothetical protein
VSIVGTGFAFGATVMFDRERTDARIYARSTGDTVLTFLSPAHAAGQVNVVVTNPGGQSDTLAGGFTYALPQSLIPVDGRWWGFDRDENAVVLYFKDGKLTGVTCEPFVTITFVSALAVEDGEFTYSTPDGIGLKGTITSPSTAVGTINLPPCISGWAAIPI